MATDAARLAAYRKLEGRSSVISSSNRADDRKSLRTSVDRDGKSPRTSRELRRMSTERKRALRPPPALERSVWEDSPRSSIQSFIVARPYRHSDCAISLLPAEILGHVFELLATEMPPRAPGGALDQIGSIGWIAVSHVCRHWREISLGMAKMWAQSVGTLTAAAETMLERAQGTPITLSLNDSHRDASFHIAHLHFAKSLIIDLTDTSYSSNVLYAMRTSLAMQPLPTLETLSIVHAFGEIPPHNFDLQPIHAPSLRCISMENYFLPWHSLALTDLTLARTKTQMESHPSFSEILKLLRSTPTLQRLSLRNWIPETGALSEGEQRVSLPFLARIEIRDRPAQCTALWSALAVPASARVVIAVDLLGVAPIIAAGVPNTIFRALGPHYRVPHAAPFEYVALTDCRGDSFLRMRAAVRTDKASTPMPSLSVDFWPWRSPRGITGFQHALAAFALHVGVAHVRTLALDCSADDDVGDAAMLGWREALEPMAALRSLEIHDRAPLSLSRALGYPDVGQVNGEPARKDFRRLLLPGLHSLILRPCPHRRRDEARVLDWMVLCNSLRQRTETNRALRQLQLYGYFRLEPPTPTRKFQDELDNVVIEISWDI